MSERMTRPQCEAVLGQVNNLLNRDTGDEGAYLIEGVYGGLGLYRRAGHGYAETVGYRMTTREMYYVLKGMRDALESVR